MKKIKIIVFYALFFKVSKGTVFIINDKLEVEL